MPSPAPSLRRPLLMHCRPPTMRSPLPVPLHCRENHHLHIATLLHSSLTVVQIRRPFRRFHSILNVAAAAVNASNFASLTGTLAIDHHDLMGRSLRCRRNHRKRTVKSEQLSGMESRDHSCADSTNYSEGADSTTSSSSTASTILKDCNILRDGGNKGIQIGRWRSVMRVGV